jgi:hypothetical protein
VTEAREVLAAVVDFCEVEARGWKGRAGTAAKLEPSSTQFLHEAVVGLAAENKAQVDRLKLDGRTIAAGITLFSGDRAWFWKTAYDESYARFSPGVQLTLDLTDRLAADERLSLVDSCAVPGHAMIEHLWGGRVAMADWLVPLSAGSAAFSVGLAAERTRRAMLAPARRMRDRLRR